MKKYFLDDKGIDVIVKNIIKKLFESQNYINLRNSISSLRTDLDKVSTSSNEVIQCQPSNITNNTSETQLLFSYPSGFNKDNTIVIGNYCTSMYLNNNSSPGCFRIDAIRFYDYQFYVHISRTNEYHVGGNIYIYLMKKPSV